MFFSSLSVARCQVPDLTAAIAELQHYHDQKLKRVDFSLILSEKVEGWASIF
jgi:hypothetical protein